MKCAYCQERAGWFKRICADCQRLHELYTQQRGQIDLLQFLDICIDTGLPREKIETFMNADPYGSGSIKDQITAAMSTELLGAMGIRVQQTAQDVKHLREKGVWQRMDEKPEE